MPRSYLFHVGDGAPVLNLHRHSLLRLGCPTQHAITSGGILHDYLLHTIVFYMSQFAPC
uniref:Uncharacterized protein n=1 Tax=Oryza sativa subsp. japonica TaxID=39947 RepID=Q6YX07_ORYSJ|nr:hypothetical protein [Oryza sativa Japonica Group]